VQHPVQTYALAGVGAARTRLDAAAARGLSRFVGRDAELAALDTALGRAATGGQVVAVVADAGLGKSRLCREFADICRARGMTVTVGAGVAQSHTVPLLPVLEMLREYFGITDSDDGRAAREKVAGRLLLLDDTFRDALPVVFDFLGVADPENLPPAQMTPEARQRALFATIARLVGAASDERPGLIVVEDLHWLDPGSEAFLRNLVDALPATRTLIVVNFRPEYHGDWMRRSYAQQLPLAPLDADAIAELVSALIGTDPSLAGLPELIAAHTAGNPFFIEEVVRRLVEDGSLVGAAGAYRLAHPIEQLDIPPTVQALLAARIDRLGACEKKVLQAAAVAGHEFSEPVLRRVSEVEEQRLRDALDTLSRAELVYERTLYPVAEYAFKHPLTAEVAYRSQLGARRATLHARAAQAIEEVYPDRLDELAAVISHHWEQAFDPLAGAQWGARAAAWAGQSNPTDALRYWRRVRDLLTGRHDDPEAAPLVLGACIWILQFGWRLGIDDAEVEDVFSEARELAAGNTWAQAAVAGAHGIARGMVGDVPGALRSSEEARRLADEAGDVGLRMSVGTTYWLGLSGDYEHALEDLESNLEAAGSDFALGREILGFSIVIWSDLFRAVILSETGRLAEARAAYQRAERLAVEHDDVETLGWVEGNYGALALLTGEPGDAVAHARNGVQIAERLGSSFSRATAYWGLAAAYASREEWTESLAAAEETARITAEHRTGIQYGGTRQAAVARAKRHLCDFAGAREAAAAGVDMAVRCGTPTMEVESRLELALAIMRDRPSEARAELELALETAERLGNVFVPWIHEALGDLARLHDRNEAAPRHYELARTAFERQGATGHLRRVSERLAALTV
jgi:tetratricopeptide (TPR) repeat protein